MGGITSGIGIFSGIDTQGLIEQLLAVESRPKILAQRRILNLQLQQSAYLDINTRMRGVQDSAAAFRTSSLFDAMLATSSDDTILKATATSNAAPGSYEFLVDRLVSSQQMLSRGFADKDDSALGAESFTFESAKARLARDTELSDLNGGEGVERGKIIITDDSTGDTLSVDLSRAVTVQDVVETINATAADEGFDVTASVEGGAFVLESDTFDFTVTSGYGDDTASSLGIEKTSSSNVLTGDDVYVLSDDIALTMLNDGNGIEVSNTDSTDFTIELDGATTIDVNLGPIYDDDGELEEAAVSTVGQLVERINAALDDVTGGQTSVSIASDGVSLEFEDLLGRDITLTDSGNKNVVSQLGFESGLDYAGGVATGNRVIADLQGTLLNNLNGGAGVTDDGSQGELVITDRDGGAYTVNFDVNGTFSDLVRAIEDETGGLVTATIDSTGTGLTLTDNTGGNGNFIVTGASAESLGIDTGATGVEEDDVSSGDLDHKYFGRATTFDSLGVGTGEIRITDAQGNVITVNIGSDTRTIGDFVDEVNGQFSAAGSDATIAINESGDGLLVEDDSGGSVALKIEDESGNVASALGIAGEAEDTDDNRIDGSFEITVDFESTDTLQEIADKINGSGANVTATIMNDGSTSLGYHLNIVSDDTGRDGRFVIDTGGFDLGLDTLDDGEDARVFFGNEDPADAILLTSSTNTLDDAIAGVTIDLRAASDEIATVTIASDNAKVEAAVNAFVKAFNDAVTRIDEQSKYVVETEQKGPLLGDSTMIRLRSDLFNAVQGQALEVDGPYSRLTEIGINVGEGGKIEFDVETFRDAMAADRDGVVELMTAREFTRGDREVEVDDGITVNDPDAENTFTSMGFMTIFEELGKEYINSVDGVLTMRNRSIDDQIELQNDRIEFFDIQLESKRGILEAQFLAMEKVIADLQVQQSALAGLTSALG